MAEIRILEEACTGCGLCVESCPVGAISLGEDGIALLGDACNLCGNCVDECPCQAIERTGTDPAGEMDVSHLARCRDVWVLVELRAGEIADCTYELLGEARRLVEGKHHQVAAALLCGDREDYPQKLIAAGADKVYLVEDPILKDFRDQPYTTAMCGLIQEEKPLAILVSATAMGRSAAPRIAARLGTGLSADCTSLELRDNGILVQTRPAFGGNLFASILCPRAWPQMATVRSKVMRPMEPDPGRAGEVISKHYSLDETEIGTRVLEFVSQANESPVDEAAAVVSAGFGASDDRGLELVSQLAGAFGAAMGTSRKMVDAGLVDYERQVGQTGKTVGPDLYIACGISGAVQHIVGISSSKVIVAIDQDPNAPIFQVADIGIVADLYEFLPKLTAARLEYNNAAVKQPAQRRSR